MKRIIMALALGAGLCISGYAAEFFSTENCANWLTLGARVGINTSNRTVGKNVIEPYSRQSWGTGFDAGVVADINFRDYIAIQPGVFFESRSGDYTFLRNYTDESYSVMQAGHSRSCNITIPVMASFRFNLTDNLRWLVEAGPYVGFVLGSSHKDKALLANSGASGYNAELPFRPETSDVDFGLKLGTGLVILDHYYIGVHYEAGMVNAYKDIKVGGFKQEYGGRTKEWLFTLGYNF